MRRRLGSYDLFVFWRLLREGANNSNEPEKRLYRFDPRIADRSLTDLDQSRVRNTRTGSQIAQCAATGADFFLNERYVGCIHGYQ